MEIKYKIEHIRTHTYIHDILIHIHSFIHSLAAVFIHLQTQKKKTTTNNISIKTSSSHIEMWCYVDDCLFASSIHHLDIKFYWTMRKIERVNWYIYSKLSNTIRWPGWKFNIYTCQILNGFRRKTNKAKCTELCLCVRMRRHHSSYHSPLRWWCSALSQPPLVHWSKRAVWWLEKWKISSFQVFVVIQDLERASLSLSLSHTHTLS